MKKKKNQKRDVLTVTKEIIKSNKKEIFLKVLTSVMLRGSLLVIPIMYSRSIDNVPLGNYEESIKYLALALFITLFYYFCSHINNITYYNFYDKMYRKYNWEIIKSTQSNSAYSLSRFSLGEYSNMLNTDLAIIVDFIDTGIIRIVKVLEFLFIYGYFFMMNKTIFVISILISIVAISINLFRGPKTERYNLNRKVTLDNYISTVNDTFLGMKEIKSLNLLDKVKGKVVGSNDEYLMGNKDYNIYYQGGKFVVLGLIEFVRYALLIYGVYLISIGQLQLGTVILIYTYYQKMVDNFSEICIMNVEYRNFKVSLRRINKVFEYSNQDNNYKVASLDDAIGEIKFENILYGNREDPILKKVTFEIEPNSITTITGKIGSGKTGIFDLLMRINRQHEGTITINNIDINDIDQNLYYNLVAIARKVPTFFDMSIMDNLKLILDDKERIYYVCNAMGIDDIINNLSSGYDTSINSREVNTELKQMLSLARVFIKDPEIMLFDEIIDTLDDNNKETVLKLLKQLSKNHTIMIISRSNDMIEFASNVITMERNTIKSIEKK